MSCTPRQIVSKDKQFSVDYHDLEKHSIGNARLVELHDGTTLDEVTIEYPVGHKVQGM